MIKQLGRAIGVGIVILMLLWVYFIYSLAANEKPKRPIEDVTRSNNMVSQAMKHYYNIEGWPDSISDDDVRRRNPSNY